MGIFGTVYLATVVTTSMTTGTMYGNGWFDREPSTETIIYGRQMREPAWFNDSPAWDIAPARDTNMTNVPGRYIPWPLLVCAEPPSTAMRSPATFCALVRSVLSTRRREPNTAALRLARKRKAQRLLASAAA